MRLAVGYLLWEVGLGCEGPGQSVSNTLRGTPDCRMMLCSVPRFSSLWSGTGTVTVLSSPYFCMIAWLPFLAHALKAIRFENAACFFTGEDSKLRQPLSQPE
jgi:hypothetical protein